MTPTGKYHYYPSQKDLSSPSLLVKRTGEEIVSEKAISDTVYRSAIAFFSKLSSDMKEKLYSQMFNSSGSILETDHWRFDIQNPTKTHRNLQIQTKGSTIATILVPKELELFGDSTTQMKAKQAEVVNYIARQLVVLLKSGHKRVVHRGLPFEGHHIAVECKIIPGTIFNHTGIDCPTKA
ncbi:MAG: hypothetical protein K9M07_04385 [Simkaniaceae bacterium]|nr:hypothetical protein [Simkaniaceae bacterium]